MKVLFATDESEGALAGARFLSTLSRTELELRVLTVVNELDDSEGEPALSAARDALGPGWAAVRSESRRGNAAEQILQAAEDEPTDLLVVGSRGIAGLARFFLGSVAERVARHSPCPVLVARGADGPPRNVLVGIDGSECSEEAAKWLLHFPLPSECTVRLITVLPPAGDIARASRMVPLPLAQDPVALEEQVRSEAQERLEALAEAFRGAGRQVGNELRGGHGALGLVQAAEEWPADLLVVGAHGMGAVERFLLGSVSEHMLRHAPCSVLVVKQN